MAEISRSERLDQPRESRFRRIRVPRMDPDGFGRGSEAFARFMGTAQFLIYMTIFVVVWLAWNTFLPESMQFDPRALNYTLLTLILSLQASYAAPLILLAQNRQDDRDRVALEQDRSRDERNLADTEYLTREVAALRLALRDVATRDFVRSELRDLLEEMREHSAAPQAEAPVAQRGAGGDPGPSTKAAKSARRSGMATSKKRTPAKRTSAAAPPRGSAPTTAAERPTNAAPPGPAGEAEPDDGSD